MTLQVPATGRDLHIDVPLSNIVVNRRPDGFIADQLLPITPVGKQSNLYRKFFSGLWRRYEPGLSLRAPGTEAKKVGLSVTSDTYFAKNYALAAEWPVEDQVNADEVLQWATNNANLITDRLMTDYEMRIAALAVNTSNVSQVRTVAVAWSINTAPVLRDLLDAKEVYRKLTGKEPNRLVIPEQVMTYLKTNETLRATIYGQNNGGLVTPEQIANLVGVDQVLRPRSLVNTADEASTLLGSFSYADVWGPHVWFASVNLLAGQDTDTWLNAFRWTSPLFGVPMAVQRHPYDTKKKIYEVEVGYYQDEKVVSPDLGMRIMNVVTPAA